MYRLGFLLSFLILAACDSPRNHRVRLDNSAQGQLASLSFTQFPIQVEAQWLVGPVGTLGINNQLLVIVKDKSGALVSLPEGYSLGFYSTMPSMGHPMDDAGYFEDLGSGIFVNKTIKYNMGGDWRNEIWIMDSDYNVVDKVLWDDFF